MRDSVGQELHKGDIIAWFNSKSWNMEYSIITKITEKRLNNTIAPNKSFKITGEEAIEAILNRSDSKISRKYYNEMTSNKLKY